MAVIDEISTSSHDYAHCANEECTLKEKCYRHQLVKWHKKHPEIKMWCSYAGFSQNENGECDYFMEE